MKLLRHVLLFAGTILLTCMLKAQNGQYDVQFSVKKWDCTAKKIAILVQVRAHDMAHTFRMGDANYRFEYDSRQLTSPRIISQENFSNIAPSSDLNYGPQNLNGSSEGSTVGIVSLNTFYSGTNQGAKLVDTAWAIVSCIEFDIIALSGCFPITWHDDKTFPITGMNEVELLGVGNYNLHVVSASGVFNNVQACSDSYCSSNVIHTIDVSTINVPEDSIVTACFAIKDANLYDTYKAASCGDPKNGTANYTIDNDKKELCITYRPNANYEGKDSICIEVCDNNTASLCQKVIVPISIQPRGDKPTVVVLPVTVQSDSTYKGCFTINDIDKGDNFTVSSCGTSKGTVLTNIQNGQVCINYTPKRNYIGQDTICVTICDSYGLCTNVTIPVSVTACADRNKPTLKCPASVDVSTFGDILSNQYDFISKVTLNDNCTGVKIFFENPEAKGDCATPSVSQVSGLPTGSVFNVGANDIVFEARTSNGLTAQCAVKVNVSTANLIAPDIDSVTICTGQTFTLIGKRSDRATFKWVGTNGFNSPTQSIRFVKATSDYTATYVYVLNTGSCVFQDSVHVKVLDKPKALQDAYKIQRGTVLQSSVLLNDSLIANTPFKINVKSGVNNGSLSFNPNGTFGYIPAANFIGKENFIYEVCYEQCPNMCDIAKVDIEVLSNERVGDIATNVITPNGDGVNDALVIEGLDASSPNNNSKITIYNQWGNIVYQAQPYKNEWAGTYNNIPLPDGTYYLIFRKDNTSEPIKSFVTIMR